MSVPPPPPPAQDADTLLSALVASASVANTPAAGAARPSTAAWGGDRGQISFAADPPTDEMMVQGTETALFPESTTDPTVLGRSTGGSKFGVVALRTSECADKLLCLGLKRGRATFCIDPKCAKAGDHGTGLAPVDLGPSGGLFITKNPASAFCTPVISLSEISQETLDQVQHEKHTMEEWTKKFVAMKRLNQVKKEGHLDASLKETEHKISKADSLRTPFTLKKATSTSTSFVVENFSPHHKILDGDLKDVIRKITVDSSLVPITLREIEDLVMEAGEVIQTLSLEQQAISRQNSTAVEALGIKFDKLSMEIGPREDLPDEYQAPTLWGIISSMIRSIQESSPSTTESHQRAVDSRLAAVKSSIATFFSTIQGQVSSKLSSTQVETRNSVDKLRNQFVQGFKGILDRLSALESNTTLTNRILTIETKMSSHEILLSQLGTSPQMFGATQTTSNTGSPALQNKVTALEGEIANLRTLLGDANLEMQRLKGKVDTSTIKFGNLGLATVDDCKAWVALKFGSRANGLLFDLNLVLEWCAPQENGDVLSMLTTMEKRHKMQIATTNEARAIYAMKNEFPQLLYKDFPGTGRDPSFLTAMKEYLDWESPETGVRDRILNRLGNMNSMFGEQIATTMANEPEARSLALSMLSVSVGCCRELVTYFDETMNELTIKSKFTTRKAFSLVTQVVRRFFMDLYKVRAQVYSSLSTTDSAGQCAWILYGVLRTHDVMSDYVKARFKNHPSVSSEYIRFLSTNSGFESLKTLEDQVESLKRTSAQLVKDVTSAKKASDTASSTVDSVKKDVTELKKQAQRRGGSTNGDKK